MRRTLKIRHLLVYGYVLPLFQGLVGVTTAAPEPFPLLKCSKVRAKQAGDRSLALYGWAVYHHLKSTRRDVMSILLRSAGTLLLTSGLFRSVE